MAKQKEKLNIKGNEVSIISDARGDFICLTDMAKGEDVAAGEFIRRWLRSGPTIEFLGTWEHVHNPEFNLVLWNQIKSQYTNNAFIMTVKRWLETNARGIRAKAGRYGGTYAHFDIAIHFANWLSPEFYVYLIKDYERLKQREQYLLGNPLGLSREFVKVYYRLQTDSIEQHLIPPLLREGKKEGIVYASEADMINEVVFGMTAKEWRRTHPKKEGNQRDHASLLQLMVLGALEVLDAKLIAWDCDKTMRRDILSSTADEYLSLIPDSKAYRQLEEIISKQDKALGKGEDEV